MSELVTPTQAFIDGKYVDAASGATLETYNPSSGQVLASIADCGTEDVERAVSVARAAFEKGSWSRISPSARKPFF